MSQGRIIAKLVQDAESITISNTKVVGDINECLLKYMTNMKRLRFCKWYGEPDDDVAIDWMQREYPTLEYFAWHSSSHLPFAKAIQFIQHNESINFFSLYVNSCNTLLQYANEAIRIDELFFAMSRNTIPASLDELHLL